MKKNEIALIIVVVIVAGLASYFLLGSLMESPSDAKKTVKVVDPISATLETPSTKVFNGSAIDPAVPTVIGDSSNQQPFNQSAQ